MKAALLTGIRQIEIRDVPEPSIKEDTDVLLRVATVGVCGSDVHYYLTGRIGEMAVQYPFVVGHECAGVVAKVGPAVKRVKPGDRVAVEPAISCRQCDQCLAGRPNTCRNLKFISCPGQAEGALVEYIVLPERNCYKIQNHTTFEQAAIAEPLSIGIYSVCRSPAVAGAAIGILGVGPIGLSVLLAAQAENAERIYVTDKIDTRLQAARGAGACWTGNPDSIDIVSEILNAEPPGLDVVFECCGRQEALNQAFELLKPGGQLVMVGIPEQLRVSFDIDRFRRDELSIRFIRRQNNCVQPALDLIGTGKVSVDFMLTHRFGLEQAKEAFEMVAAYRDGVIKAQIFMQI